MLSLVLFAYGACLILNNNNNSNKIRTFLLSSSRSSTWDEAITKHADQPNVFYWQDRIALVFACLSLSLSWCSCLSLIPLNYLHETSLFSYASDEQQKGSKKTTTKKRKRIKRNRIESIANYNVPTTKHDMNMTLFICLFVFNLLINKYVHRFKCLYLYIELVELVERKEETLERTASYLSNVFFD